MRIAFQLIRLSDWPNVRKQWQAPIVRSPMEPAGCTDRQWKWAAQDLIKYIWRGKKLYRSALLPNNLIIN